MQITNDKGQINLKIQVSNCKRFVYWMFDNWELFVICFLLFGAFAAIPCFESDSLSLYC